MNNGVIDHPLVSVPIGDIAFAEPRIDVSNESSLYGHQQSENL